MTATCWLQISVLQAWIQWGCCRFQLLHYRSQWSLIRKESSVCLPGSYNETGKYIDSYRVLNELGCNRRKVQATEAMYFTTLADLFISRKNILTQLIPLPRSLDLVSGKRTKYRLKYLLAQLNELTGILQEQHHCTAMSLKWSSLWCRVQCPDKYCRSFRCKLGKSGWDKERAERMLKDSKNQDFHDQIYMHWRPVDEGREWKGSPGILQEVSLGAFKQPEPEIQILSCPGWLFLQKAGFHQSR